MLSRLIILGATCLAIFLTTAEANCKNKKKLKIRTCKNACVLKTCDTTKYDECIKECGPDLLQQEIGTSGRECIFNCSLMLGSAKVGECVEPTLMECIQKCDEDWDDCIKDCDSLYEINADVMEWMECYGLWDEIFGKM